MRLSFVSLSGVTLVTLAILPAVGGEAYAADRSPWYMGIGAGSTAWSANSRQLSTILSSRTDGKIGRLDSAGSGAGFHGGVRLNQFLALEARYADLGAVGFLVPNISSCTGEDACPAVVNDAAAGTLAADGWSLSAVGTFPLTERFELGGRLGLFRSIVKLMWWNASLAHYPSGEPAYHFETTVHRTRPLIGIDLGYRITPNATFRLSWERINKLGNAGTTGEMNVRSLSAGIKVDF